MALSKRTPRPTWLPGQQVIPSDREDIYLGRLNAKMGRNVRRMYWVSQQVADAAIERASDGTR